MNTVSKSLMINKIIKKIDSSAKSYSWNNVRTSSCVNKAGLSFVGFVKLQTIAHTGCCIEPSAFLQPPFYHAIRFFSGINWINIFHLPL